MQTQTITPDFLLSQLRLALVAVLAYGGGAHWFTPEAAGLYLTLFTTLGPIVIPWAWSIFSNLGRVSVQSGSAAAQVAAVEKTDPASASVGAATAVAATVKILLVAFALSFLVAGGSAMAQAPVKLKTPGQIARDIQNAVAGKPQQATDTSGNPIVSLLSKPMQDLADFISAGFTEAVSLSTAVPELQDGNGQACWAMMNNYSAVLKAHPIPLTLHAAADLESIRLLNMAANKICQNSACTQVFTDAGNLVNAAMPIGMPLPNLTAICSKVPEIAIVSPTLPIVPLPASAPAPVATPAAQ